MQAGIVYPMKSTADESAETIDGEPFPGFQSCLYEVAERIDHTGYLHEYAGSEEYYETADDAAAALIGFATD